MLISILFLSRISVKASLVNWLPWIGIENRRPAVFCQRLLQCLDAEIRGQCDREPMRQNAAAEPVDDRNQIDKSSRHRNICDVGAPCVDGPLGSSRNLQDSTAVRKRSCVRPVYAASWPLAQMGSANDIQTHLRRTFASGAHGFCRSSVRPIVISCYALKPSAPARGSGGYRLPPIRFTTRHHGPDDPGHLVGQSNSRDLPRPALQQLQ